MKKLSFLFSPSHLLASCFFLGYTPLAPGTATSLVAMTTLFFLPKLSILTYIILLNALFFVGAIVCEQVSNHTNTKDASFMVIDEWFGMSLSLFLVPKNLWLYLLGFVLFRFFDVVKPKPISSLEKNVPGGLGVMLDDAAAGFFTFVILQIVALFSGLVF
jgi:phosphatidylglycerophosphatase A